MGVFDKILKADESLFKNAEALDSAFIPKVIPYREEQQRRIATAIAPLFSDRNAKNIVIYGMPGVGKTVACKKVLQELEEKADDIIQIYVNCWEKNTSYKVVIDICDQLGYLFTQNKKTDEIYKDIIKILNKKKVVFIFDEIDRSEDHDFLYTIIEEVYKKSIILITNMKNFLEEMDRERLRSRLMPEMIEFKPYNLNETRGILKERLEYAFFSGVWETDAFESIVKKTAAMQDMRAGIQLLKDSGEFAENKASRKITADFVNQVIAKADEFTSIKPNGPVVDQEKLILSIIKKHTNSKIGDLYKVYTNAGGNYSYKTFQRKLDGYEEQGIIKLTKSSGDGGNTKIVEYKEEVKKLNEF